MIFSFVSELTNKTSHPEINLLVYSPNSIIVFSTVTFDEPTEVEKKFDLIDKFIKNSPKIEISKDQKSDPNLIIETKIKDELITETLAKIYVNQKKFNKAIKAYEILSLKYPKKSSFFADQIIDIKKLKIKD